MFIDMMNRHKFSTMYLKSVISKNSLSFLKTKFSTNLQYIVFIVYIHNKFSNNVAIIYKIC